MLFLGVLELCPKIFSMKCLWDVFLVEWIVGKFNLFLVIENVSHDLQAF